MRSIYSIILCFSLLLAKATDEAPRAIVWVDGSTFYEALGAKGTATLYFPKWESTILHHAKKGRHSLVLQLDNEMDPNPEDGEAVPSLAHLAPVANDSLLAEYFSFLEKYGRTAGFGHLVLPDTSNLSSREKHILERANQSSPFYFIHRSSLSSQVSQKKSTEETPVIWVLEQGEKPRKAPRWLRKRSRANRAFYDGIRLAERKTFEPVENLPLQLSLELFRHGVIAVDPAGILPLGNQPISVNSSDAFENVISRYAEPGESQFTLDWESNHAREVLITSGDGDTARLILPLRADNEEIILGQMLFGASPVMGLSERNGSRVIPAQQVLGYSTVELEGLDPNQIRKLDSVAQHAIENYAIPGCQISVVRNGSVVLEESYGHYTYDSLKQVNRETIYDLASVTKVLATVPAVALLIDQGKITLDDTLGMHVPMFANSNKSGITIRRLLAHHGGVRSYIPFWRWAMDGDRLETFYYKTKADEEADNRSYGIEPSPLLVDSLKSWITKTDLIPNPNKYNYSDVGFMILHLLVEEVSDMPFDQFLESNFYEPMGLNISFNPTDKGFTYQDIAPTEYDDHYREAQVWGEVHDGNAFAFGGVAGHAGLFANATDIAKMLYMLSSGGVYGGRQYLSKETLNLFNVRYFDKNRRGLGWDKKDWIKDSASNLASDSSYGHTGFTGTMVWTDPDKDLIFVFLSNRIYPDSNNDKLMEMNIRTEMHDVVYQSIPND